MWMRLLCLLMFLGLAGCATPGAHCDGRLEPINKQATSHAGATQRRAVHGTAAP